jgi:hypothetical protein
MLRDAPADFPRPRPELTDTVRRHLLRRASRPSARRHVRRTATVAAALFVASMIGFTLGRWAVPSHGAAATPISLDVRPLEVEAYFAEVNAYGVVAGGQSGQTVVVEGRACSGYGQWLPAATVETGNGGAWIAKLGPTSTTVFRARSKDGTSGRVTVRVHPHVELVGTKGTGGRFEVRIAAGDFFEGRRGVLERLSGGRWIRVRTFTIHRRNISGSQVPWSFARFRAQLKAGSTVRAVVPKAQVGRCYLAGFSNIARV